jgi:hypothetical protein
LMATPDSNGWPGTARMVPSLWRSAGHTCGGRFISSTPQRSRHSLPLCGRRSPSSMRSRPKSVACLPNTEDGCARREVDRSSRPGMSGCKSRRADLSRIGPGQGHPLCAAPLAGPDRVPRDGRIEMDTNTVERAIRPITLNRKMPWQIPPDPPQLRN